MTKRILALGLVLAGLAPAASAQAPAASAPAPSPAAADREADHQALRQMLATVKDAVNSRKVDQLAPLFADRFSVILADGQLVTDLPALKAYYDRLLDPATGPLASLTVNPVADDLTTFLGPDVGVCHGTSSDVFVIRNGPTRTLDSRWTVTLVRQGGAWKIAAVHAGSNILDNAILQEHQALTRMTAGGAVALGLFGALVGFVLGRRARA